MTRDQLLTAFRARVFDTAAPYLWSDDEAFEYLEDGIAEACERALLLRDSMTPEICEVAIIAGTAEYELDARIIEVLRAKLDSRSVPLALTSTDELDRNHRGWQACNGPSRVAIDAEGAGWKATLVGVPGEDDTLRLQVFRLPLEPLATDNDEPEFNPRLHIRLVDWMEYRAYSKKDAETLDEKKAAAALAVFTSAFGVRIDANMRRTQRDRSASVVQFRELG